MRVFQEPESDLTRNALTFGLGAVGGLAIGMLLSRQTAPAKVSRLGAELRERAGRVARRLRPARLRRMAVEQEELTQLEDRVLDAFMADAVLSERGVDVGAISHGIIELSGSVWSETEADRAVSLTNSVEGVRTVVNRMDVELGGREGAGGPEGAAWSGRMVGMNQRRQGRQTEKRDADDSQAQETEALRDADLAQYEDEDIAYRHPKVQARPDAADPWQVDYDEDELDNQDPHGKNARYTLDQPPQELNTSARVFRDPLKPAERLSLEQSDVPVKPSDD